MLFIVLYWGGFGNVWSNAPGLGLVIARNANRHPGQAETWEAARQALAIVGPSTVAKKLGVPLRTVQKWAACDEWPRAPIAQIAQAIISAAQGYRDQRFRRRRRHHALAMQMAKDGTVLVSTMRALPITGSPRASSAAMEISSSILTGITASWRISGSSTPLASIRSGIGQHAGNCAPRCQLGQHKSFRPG
jgi:hypothetical protein